MTMLLCGYVVANREARRRVKTGGKSTPGTARQLYVTVMLSMCEHLMTGKLNKDGGTDYVRRVK